MTSDREANTRAAVDALTAAVSAEHDFPGWLAAVLAQVAARKGSSDALTAGRPGSWEASLVDQLVKGTVGYDDESLPEPGSPHDHARPGVSAQRAAAALARAVLEGSPPRAVQAAEQAPCAACLAISAMQLGYALVTATAGQSYVTDQLRLRLARLLDVAEGELGSALN